MTDTHLTINTPDKALNSYATEIGVNIEQDNLSEVEAFKLFQIILWDYLKEKISPDDLSSYCEMIYGKVPVGSRTFSILLEGAEMSWELRNNPTVAADTISELLKFFQIKVK